MSEEEKLEQLREALELSKWSLQYSALGVGFSILGFIILITVRHNWFIMWLSTQVAAWVCIFISGHYRKKSRKIKDMAED